MFFTLQKTIWFIAMPPASLILPMLVGAAISRRHRKLGHVFILAGLFFFYTLSLSPVADRLLTPLESYAPPLQELPMADAVVVPGGGSVDLTWAGAPSVPNGETLTRLIKGVELARKLNLPLVLTGGNGEPFATTLNDADIMAKTARAMGMPANQLIVENRSRDTLENSFAVRKLVKGDRIILTTSAYYMERAIAMFSKRGFTVIPAPTYFLAQTRKTTPALLIPRASSFAHSTVALAEWASLVWWGLRGEL